MDKRELERKSSAVTLSDMEVFIFPELLYGLVLADIMSPRIWAWRDDPWFAGLDKMKVPRRINRLKQFIMDHYDFNLDLDTWGLTTKPRELARFKDFIDLKTLAQSNALFGYEGDKYYFDIDIRSHFGLDKYDSDTIPYWKTETVEAMDAFRFKSSYRNGAGECVSLAVLYAAALFIVAGIPLEDIFLMATPLHSQNFVDAGEGILTNNRRLVTKKMWFNGTALSAQARRALENERVTVVAHAGGWAHILYPRATIKEADYVRFRSRLGQYLKTPLNEEILGNFLRHHRDFQPCFQLRCPLHGSDHYIELERVFAYEHGSPYLLTDRTREQLLQEIDTEEFKPAPLSGRVVFNEVEEFARGRSLDLSDSADRDALLERFANRCLPASVALKALCGFCCTHPRLPEPGEFVPAGVPLGLTPGMGREEAVARLEAIRFENELAAAAFLAYRDFRLVSPEPFVYAALTRNPVSLEGTKCLDLEEAYRAAAALDGDSVYDGPYRLAQPDEVWNFRRGDGLEKALLMANILFHREKDPGTRIILEDGRARVEGAGKNWSFPSAKRLGTGVWPAGAWAGISGPG